MKLRSHFLSCLLLLVLTQLIVTDVYSAKTIAILDFKVNSTQEQLQPLGKGISDMLAVRLGSSKDLSVVERSRLQDALEEQGLSRSGFIDEGSAVKVGMTLGANAMLLGSLTDLIGELSLDIRVVDVQTSKVEGGISINGTISTLRNMVDEAATRLRLVLLDKKADVYNVSGIVLGPNNKGLADISIDINNGSDVVVTDSSGHWKKVGLIENALITPTSNDWTFNPPMINVNSKLTGEVVIKATPFTYKASGYIIDNKSKAISGVKIDFGSYGTTITDANGRWSKDGLSKTVTANLSKDGYSFSPPKLVLSRDNTEVTVIGSTKSYTASGLIVDTTGKGIQGVRISLGPYGECTTDAAGRWRKDGLRESVIVTPTKEGWEFETGPVSDENLVTLVGKLASHKITGRVVDATGKGVQGVTISLTNSSMSTSTDNSGNWTLDISGNTGILVPYKADWTFSPSTLSVNSTSQKATFKGMSTAYEDGVKIGKKTASSSSTFVYSIESAVSGFALGLPGAVGTLAHAYLTDPKPTRELLEKHSASKSPEYIGGFTSGYEGAIRAKRVGSSLKAGLTGFGLWLVVFFLNH